MRLAVVADSDAFGGAEVYARQLLRRAPEFVQRTVLAAAPVVDELRGAYSVRTIPLTRHRASAPELRRLLDRLAPDVVHVNLVDPASNIAAMEAALACAPAVVKLHLEGSLGPDPAALRAAYADVAGALAPSAVIAAQLCEEIGVPAARVHHIRNGVDIPPRPVRRVRRPGERLVVGAVGRLTEQKGFDILIEAVRRIDPHGQWLDVVVAGSGRDAETLHRQATGLPVRFVGHCDEVPAFVRTLDAFCLPSRREALSLALLEAMAAGLPCVTTAVGDTAEAVGDAAVVVAPEDVDAVASGLEGLLRADEWRSELGNRARARAVRDFDAERMVSETLTVLAEAAAGRPAA
jgi:glycosyltransferase involved in cell wall biosynthesis